MGKTKYKNIRALIKANLSRKEHGLTAELIKELRGVKKRGYFTRSEFLKIGDWKAPRAKKWRKLNSNAKVVSVSKTMFATRYEKKRMDLLTSLSGVRVPTASAILMLTDPRNYGVIDIWVWRLLYHYGEVTTKPTGTNLSFKNWYPYLMKLRYWAKQFKVSTRAIERTLFFYADEEVDI